MNLLLQTSPQFLHRFSDEAPSILSGEDFLPPPGEAYCTLIGEGRYGQIYLAQYSRDNSQVIIKLHKRPDTLKHILHECSIGSVVSQMGCSPKFIGLLKMSREGYHKMNPKFNRFASVFEFVPVLPSERVSMSLKEAIIEGENNNPLLTRDQWYEAAYQMVDITDTLSKEDVYHGDIQASNILVQFVNDEFSVKLIDFGLSVDKHTVRKNKDKPMMTAAQLEKSSQYDPELQRCTRPLPTSDLYSVMRTFEKVGQKLKIKPLSALGKTYTSLPIEERFGHEEVKKRLLKLKAEFLH